MLRQPGPFLRKPLVLPTPSLRASSRSIKTQRIPQALKEMKAAGDLAASCELRQSKYLNKIIEQDHRLIKRLVKPGLGFFSFETAWNTLQGYESMNMIRKGQMHGVEKGNITGQISFIASLFGLVA